MIKVCCCDVFFVWGYGYRWGFVLIMIFMFDFLILVLFELNVNLMFIFLFVCFFLLSWWWFFVVIMGFVWFFEKFGCEIWVVLVSEVFCLMIVLFWYFCILWLCVLNYYVKWGFYCVGGFVEVCYVFVVRFSNLWEWFFWFSLCNLKLWEFVDLRIWNELVIC